jgi:chromosome partitioning protein
MSPQRRARFDGTMTIAPYRNDLNKVVILNPKGGCGKTTLATNLASYFALRGPPPTLIDADPNGYTGRWLERRPRNSCKINGIANDRLAMHGKRSWPFRMPKEAGAVIIDTPAALSQREISEVTYDADCILVPVLPSAFDVQVTTNFIAELLLLTDFDRPVAVVANRTRQNTKSLAMLMRILTSLETPTVAVLRDSQNYVHAAAHGLGIYEMPHHRVKKDIEQMDLIINWLDRHLMRTLEHGLISRFNPLPKLFAPSTGGLTHPD